MSVFDDYLDVKHYVEGTDFADSFHRFATWAFRLEGSITEIQVQNVKLREAITLVQGPGSVVEPPPPTNEDRVVLDDFADKNILPKVFLTFTAQDYIGDVLLERFKLTRQKRIACIEYDANVGMGTAEWVVTLKGD